MNYKDSQNNDLERWATDELGKLPELKAPESLVPNVMNRIVQMEKRAWWQRPFSDWNIICQSAFVFLCGLIIVFGIYLSEFINTDLIPVSVNFSDIPFKNYSPTFLTVLQTLFSTLSMLFQQFKVEILIIIILSFCLYLICVGSITIGFKLLYSKGIRYEK